MLKLKKLLVAGASGFLGRNFLLSTPNTTQVIAIYHKSKDFINFLSNKNLSHIQPVQIDLTNPVQIEKLSCFCKDFDACIYFAANGNPARSIQEPLFDLEANITGIINLLEKHTFKKFIFFSSGAVYDGILGAVNPQKSVVNPKLPYAISKLASEQYLKFYKKHKRIEDLKCVRFFGAYGPHEPARKIYTKLVKQFGIDKNPTFEVKGDGRNLIDAMFIDDTIRGINLLLNDHSNASTEVIDFCSQTPLSLKELVIQSAKTFNLNVDITYEGHVPEYIDFFSTDNYMLKKHSFSPSISLKKGLRKHYYYLLSESIPKIV